MNYRTRTPIATVAAVAVAAVTFTAGILVAKAKSGGATVNKLSYAGSVQPVPPAGTAVSFTFVNTDDSTTCAAPAGNPVFDANGNFVAQVDLSGCTNFAFNGGNVTYAVSVGNVTIGSPQPVNPVPYAKYADTAANAADGGAIGTALTALQTQLSDLAAKQGAPLRCPVGYVAQSDAGSPVICQNGPDEMVQVGTGGSMFWIDRYEATVWTTQAPGGSQYGVSSADYPGTFPANGQWTTPLYAVSVANQWPSAYLTWFQANAACRASGKRLPSGSEWLAAAQGTPTASTCNAGKSVWTLTRTGANMGCASRWGAIDMIGNAWEMTDEWYAGVGTVAQITKTPERTPWGALYDNAGTWNISSSAFVGIDYSPVVGAPAVATRGGTVDSLDPSIFALNLDPSPAGYSPGNGFRCVIGSR